MKRMYYQTADIHTNERNPKEMGGSRVSDAILLVYG